MDHLSPNPRPRHHPSFILNSRTGFSLGCALFTSAGRGHPIFEPQKPKDLLASGGQGDYGYRILLAAGNILEGLVWKSEKASRHPGSFCEACRPIVQALFNSRFSEFEDQSLYSLAVDALLRCSFVTGLFPNNLCTAFASHCCRF